MKKNNAIIYLLLAAAAFALGIVVSGPLNRIINPPPHFMGPMPGGGPDSEEILGVLQKELSLTSNQSQKIRDIIDENRKKEHQYREQIRRTLDKNIPRIEGEKFDEARARAMIRSLNRVEEDIKIMQMKQIYDITDVLTPSQYDRFLEMRKNRMGLLPGGGPGGPGGPPPGHDGPPPDHYGPPGGPGPDHYPPPMPPR